MPLLWNICTSALFPTPASPDIATSAYSQRSHTSVLLCFLPPAQPYDLALPSNTAQAGSGQVRPITRTLQRIIGGGGPEKNGFCVMLPILAAELRTRVASNRFPPHCCSAFEFLRRGFRKGGHCQCHWRTRAILHCQGEKPSEGHGRRRLYVHEASRWIDRITA